MEKLDLELHSKFLRFTWSRSRIPTSRLNTYFKIQAPHPNSYDNPDEHLPTAQTCFFSICIPKYSSLEIMIQKLEYAINHCIDLDNDYLL